MGKYGLETLQNFIRMLEVNKWMSEFYGRTWYDIKSSKCLEIANAQANTPCVLEWRIPTNQYKDIELAQSLGFTLVESMVKFQTLISKSKSNTDGIRLSKDEDFNDLINIMEECYFNHHKFYNRFKNRDFFTESQSKEYYMKSLTNFFNKDGSIVLVAEDDIGVYGFRIIKKINETEYSGVVAGVLNRAKGRSTLRKLQEKTYDIIGHDYLENNATQLGNYQVINNHISAGRKLLKIEHIFLKKID